MSSLCVRALHGAGVQGLGCPTCKLLTVSARCLDDIEGRAEGTGVARSFLAFQAEALWGLELSLFPVLPSLASVFLPG